MKAIKLWDFDKKVQKRRREVEIEYNYSISRISENQREAVNAMRSTLAAMYNTLSEMSKTNFEYLKYRKGYLLLCDTVLKTLRQNVKLDADIVQEATEAPTKSTDAEEVPAEGEAPANG